jgi:hypothetical protein
VVYASPLDQLEHELREEEKMKILTAVSLALGLALAAPVSAYAGGPHHKIHTERVERLAIPRSATALAPAPRVENGEGVLSRGPENCNRTICYDSN